MYDTCESASLDCCFIGDSLSTAAFSPELFCECLGEIPMLCVSVLGWLSGGKPAEVCRMSLFPLFFLIRDELPVPPSTSSQCLNYI